MVALKPFFIGDVICIAVAEDHKDNGGVGIDLGVASLGEEWSVSIAVSSIALSYLTILGASFPR